MGFEYLSNVPLEKAREDYLEFLKIRGFKGESERISVPEAGGRISSEPVYANICAPHYAASAMDGAAVLASDTFGARETSPLTLKAEQFTIVDTGDPIPEGKDAVIMIEELVWNKDGSVTIHAPAAPWQYIRQIGEDICAGEMIIPAHMKLSPSSLGAMLAGGVMELEVIRKPRIGIIPTGDEIVPPCKNPKPGEIMEFNSGIFSAMLKDWGAESRVYPIVPDEFEKIKEAVKKASEECDMVILNAGSSAGREDYSARAIGELGELLYHGIAIKPGKPAILGATGAVPVLGVPGYPVSGIIVIEELMKPLIDYWFSSQPEKPKTAEAVLTRPVVSGLKYQEFVRVRLGNVGGRLMATPLSRGSGVVSSFMKADGILNVAQGREGFESGEKVEIKLLSPEEKFNNSLVIIGSHDPLLDELSNLMHLEDSRIYVSSSHVGSMGGIMAVKKGEAHAAGCHLLDTESGEYNKAYIKRYFPDGGVKLVRCVGRTQGLMLQKGNPLNIKEFRDIKKPGISFVNRQKGSGTRILTDYLCKKEGIDTVDIYGYDREELTHTAVAAQIAGGTAHAGMGIYSAAKLYDLEFLPVCEEEYDLLIPEREWEIPQVRALIKTLKSEAFREKILSMGGYSLTSPGEIIPLT